MVSPSPQPGPPGAAAPPARVGQQSGGEEEGLEATSPGSFRESPGRGRPQEAPAPSTSPPPSTRGGSGARVLRRLQHLQNTAHYPSTGRTGRLCSARAPQSRLRPGNGDLEPEEGRTDCEKTHSRGPRVHSAPRPHLSPGPLTPMSN